MRVLKLTEAQAHHLAVFLRAHITAGGWYYGHCQQTFDEMVTNTVVSVEASLALAPKLDQCGKEKGHE